MNKLLTQPAGPVARKVNIQSVARVAGVNLKQVAELAAGISLHNIRVLYDRANQKAYLTGSATGNVVRC